MLEIADDVIKVQESKQVDDKDKLWCVYCHTNKINGKKYFGITSQSINSRWRDGFGYKNQTVFWNAICKYTWDGFLHDIIEDRLMIEEAKQKEKELIALHKTNVSRWGRNALGYNMTDGGDGCSGLCLSEATRKLMSANNSGKNNPNYGRPHTEDEKRRIGLGSKGKHLSSEHKIALSERKKIAYVGRNNPNCKPIYSIEFDEIFWGAKEACDVYKINKSSLCENCNGNQKSAGKHPTTNEPLHWKYVYDQIKKTVL